MGEGEMGNVNGMMGRMGRKWDIRVSASGAAATEEDMPRTKARSIRVMSVRCILGRMYVCLSWDICLC